MNREQTESTIDMGDIYAVSKLKNQLFIPTTVLLFLIAVLMIPLSGTAQTDPSVGIVEHLDEYLPADIILQNELGSDVEITSIIDKPTVVAFVYYNCPGICTPLMDGIAEVIGKVDMELGIDYQVFTISFEPKEGPELARKKKVNYMELLMKQREDLGKTDTIDYNGWQFFTGDSANIVGITEAMGYKYKKTGNDYIHSGGIILLSPDAKIVRYINKTYFIPFEFKMALIEASEGKSGPTINKLLKYCYTYDTETSGYVLNVTRVAGVIIIFLALLTLGVLVLVPKLRRKQATTDNQA